MGGPALYSLAPSLLTQIIDYSAWKYGASRAATYFSLYTLSAKTAGAIGGAAGVAVAGFYDFDPTQSIQSESGIFGVRLAIAWLPAALLMVSIGLFFLYPISEHRHRIVRRRMARNNETE